MSIQSEITRISGNVSDALDAITAKGVTVPVGSNSDDLATLIGQISGGGGSAISVVDTTDPVSGGTIRTITAVSLSGDTVTASVLLNGYTAHDANGNAITGTYVPPAPSLQAKTVSPTESQQTVSPSTGYDGLSSVTVNAIDSSYVGSGVTRRDSTDLTKSGPAVTAPAGYYASNASTSVASGTAGTPSATKGTVNNHAITVTPSVTNTTGYITGGTKTGTAVSVSASELVSGTLSITQNGTADVTNYASVDVNVSGGRNVQVYSGYDTVNRSSFMATDITLTVAKTGMYNISWMGYRSTSSGTSGSQLYVNGSAVGSANTTFVNTYGHFVSLTNQSLNEGDVLVVYAMARSSSYYMGVGNLIIEQTA